VVEGEPASVLDASSTDSALMAVLHAEDGASVVIEAIGDGAAVSVVNWAEVLSKLAEAGKDPEAAAAALRRAEGSRRVLTIRAADGGGLRGGRGAPRCSGVDRRPQMARGGHRSRGSADPLKTWSRNWSPTPPNSAELVGRNSLYQARFGSIDGFRRDS